MEKPPTNETHQKKQNIKSAQMKHNYTLKERGKKETINTALNGEGAWSRPRILPLRVGNVQGIRKVGREARELKVTVRFVWEGQKRGISTQKGRRPLRDRQYLRIQSFPAVNPCQAPS